MPDMNEVREIARDCTKIFLALGDVHRQDIMILLESQGPMNVAGITQHIDLSRPTVSHHLKVLKEAGLVRIERKSRENFYRMEWDEASAKLLAFTQKVLKTSI